MPNLLQKFNSSKMLNLLFLPHLHKTDVSCSAFSVFKFLTKNKYKMTQTTILIGLFICHWLADYTHLSTVEMLGAKRLGKPLLPIFKHAGMHTLLMFGFLGFANLGSEKLVLLSLFQLITHFLIDTWKGRMNGWFPALQSPANKWHWIVFGFDQLLHALIIIGMSFYAVS